MTDHFEQYLSRNSLWSVGLSFQDESVNFICGICHFDFTLDFKNKLSRYTNVTLRLQFQRLLRQTVCKSCSMTHWFNASIFQVVYKVVHLQLRVTYTRMKMIISKISKPSLATLRNALRCAKPYVSITSNILTLTISTQRIVYLTGRRSNSSTAAYLETILGLPLWWLNTLPQTLPVRLSVQKFEQFFKPGFPVYR